MDSATFLQGLLMASGTPKDWVEGPFVEVPVPVPSTTLASFTRELEKLKEVGVVKGDADILELFIATLRTFIVGGMAAEGKNIVASLGEAILGGEKHEE